MSTYCRGYGFNCKTCFKSCIDDRGRAEVEHKLSIELTLKELEDLVGKVKLANAYLRGNTKSELESKLSTVLAKAKGR